MSKQHQKSEGLCNNREELTGKKFPSGNGTQDPPNWDLAHRPLSYHSILRHLCNKGFTGLTCYEKKKVRHVKILARCGMLQTPPNSSQNLVLRHAAAVGVGALTTKRKSLSGVTQSGPNVQKHCALYVPRTNQNHHCCCHCYYWMTHYLIQWPTQKYLNSVTAFYGPALPLLLPSFLQQP